MRVGFPMLTVGPVPLVARAPRVGPRCARLLLILLLALMAFPLLSWGQGEEQNVHVKPLPKPEAKPVDMPTDPTLKTHLEAVDVDVDVVLVPVSITDQWKRLVAGVERDNFSLYEGSDAQEIKLYSNEDAPNSLGVIFDTSGSMSNKIEKAKEAVMEFFK